MLQLLAVLFMAVGKLFLADGIAQI